MQLVSKRNYGKGAQELKFQKQVFDYIIILFHLQELETAEEQLRLYKSIHQSLLLSSPLPGFPP
jgi:hypothetical protein